MTFLTASAYVDCCNNSLLAQAAAINCCIFIF